MFSVVKRAFSSSVQKSIRGPIVWIDCEMTGLDISKDRLIEIALLITDADLNVVAKGPELIIHQPHEVMDNMNEWCIEQHAKSGLTQQVLDSKVSILEAEKQVHAFLEKHIPKGTAPLAGNSVHVDRLFLRKEMPTVEDHLHYRIVDVSTINELAKRWYPNITDKFNKNYGHRALDDILESIEELKFYKANLFRPQ